MLKCFLAICLWFLAFSAVKARSTSGHSFQSLTEQKEDKKVTGNFWNDASFMYKIYQQCSKEDVMICLKVKLLAGLEKAFNQPRELKLMDGIRFINGEGEDNSSKPVIKTEKEIVSSLPRSIQDRDQTLNDMIMNKLATFLQSHTLQIKFPNSKDFERSMDEERKKKSKGNGALIMIPLLLGGTFLPMAYGALALLSGKALIVSKLALVLASIIGIKKLLSSSGKESQHEVVVSSGGHGGSGWGREFDIAYSEYDPSLKQKAKTL